MDDLTPAEEAELLALQRELAAPKTQDDLTPEEEAELAALQAEANAPGIGKQALDYGLRGLDYLGGATRTTAANVGDELAQLFGVYDEDRINAKDTMLAALKGKAPTTAEYLEQAGVPKGASVNLLPESFPLGLGEGDTSVRGAAGFIGDVALDPLTYASLGTTALGKKIIQESGEAGLRGAAGKAARVGMNLVDPSDVLGAVSKKIYKGGFSAVDEDIAEKGGKALSDLLYEQGFVGTNKGAQKRVEKLLKDTAAERASLYSKVNQPVMPDVSSARTAINVIADNPGLASKARDLQEYVDLYDLSKELGPAAGLPVEQASKFKTQFYEALPESSFKTTESGMKRVGSTGQKVQRELARAYKEGIEQAAEQSQKGLGSQITQANEQLQTLLNARKPLQREAKKAAKVKGFSAIDYILTGGALANPAVALGVLGTKKAGQALNTTAGRTALGQLLKKTAKPTAAAYRRTLLNTTKQKEQK